MRSLPLGLTILALAACGSGGEAPDGGNGVANAAAENKTSAEAGNAASPVANTAAPSAPTGTWQLQASGEGTALVLSGASGMRLFCPAGGTQLLVNAPGFHPIASEERLSFGSGGAVMALVAGTKGDRQRGGITGVGPVPAELQSLLAGPVSASYGAQVSGPHAAPPTELAKAFITACRKGAPASAPTPAEQAEAGSPCTTQGKERLAVQPLRAFGTEPFWAAAVTGRCVTYSHPEDQKGTRVWTRYTPGARGGGSWVGSLGGKPFQLTIRAAPGCSDGMSDRVYPLKADLLVGGERRSGCAAPQ
ncbi:MAG TPA: hypothetical protein VF655_12840 [Allosphingosinicella sp.]|jgi:uncharacterized membrane protein